MGEDTDRIKHLEGQVGQIQVELSRMSTCMEMLTSNQERLIEGLLAQQEMRADTNRNSRDIQALFKLHRDDRRDSSFTAVVTKWAPIFFSFAALIGLGVNVTLGG